MLKLTFVMSSRLKSGAAPLTMNWKYVIDETEHPGEFSEYMGTFSVSVLRTLQHSEAHLGKIKRKTNILWLHKIRLPSIVYKAALDFIEGSCRSLQSLKGTDSLM